VDGQATVVEESGEADLLVARVPNAIGDRRVIEHGAGLRVAPGEERVDDGSRAFVADAFFFLARRVRERAFYPEERADQAERRLRALGVGAQCLEEVSARVRVIQRSG
jgi:hypothetical protein